MDIAGRMAAAMFFVLFAAHQPIRDAEAAPYAKSACAQPHRGGKVCSGANRRAASAARGTARRGVRLARRPWPIGPRQRLYRGNEAAMAQLSPRLRPQRTSTLSFDLETRNGCGPHGGSARGPRRECVRQIGLPDALLQPPNAATERTLRELGIPIVPDVAPIVIVDPAWRDRDDFVRSIVRPRANPR